MEQNIGDGKKLELDLQLFNLPDVGYDSDDDDGDGYHEESEAYHGSFGKLNKLVAYKDYYFLTYWDKASGVSSIPAGSSNIIAQRSFWAIEMQTADYDLLHSTNYNRIGNSLNNEILVETVGDDIDKERIMVAEPSTEANDTGRINEVNGTNDDVRSVYDLIQYKENQKLQVKEILEDDRNVNSIKDVNVVLTFNNPISLDVLNEILRSSNAQLTNYEAKFINQNGDWVTAQYSGLNETELISKVNSLVEGKEESLEYEGVTSAKITIKFNQNDYDSLVTDENVFFADMSDELIRMENADYVGDLKIIVNDYAWLIASNN